MSRQLARLPAMPSAVDFFEKYWNIRPFVVENAVPAEAVNALISADELAGLALEENAISRIVETPGNGGNWTCRYGPFSENDFSALDDQGWSLLVGNVEQFHPPTAKLLRFFNFAPRWMLDDVMVSYSAREGSVGPHLDSYHVFLLQGQGGRRWKVADQVMLIEDWLDGTELKVLSKDFVGDEVDLKTGDVLYIPPNFPHQGVTLKAALTYSVGFLGPKASELFSAYGAWLARHEAMDERFTGQELTASDQGFAISATAAEGAGRFLQEKIYAKPFRQWLAEFFSESSHQDFGRFLKRDQPVTVENMHARLQTGAGLIKPEYVKMLISHIKDDLYYLGVDGHGFELNTISASVMMVLSSEQELNLSSVPELDKDKRTLRLVCQLYNREILQFV